MAYSDEINIIDSLTCSPRFPYFILSCKDIEIGQSVLTIYVCKANGFLLILFSFSTLKFLLYSSSASRSFPSLSMVRYSSLDNPLGTLRRGEKGVPLIGPASLSTSPRPPALILYFKLIKIGSSDSSLKVIGFGFALFDLLSFYTVKLFSSYSSSSYASVLPVSILLIAA